MVSSDVTGEHGIGPHPFGTNSGTSFSAPIVSGVIALMLEANPLLGYRDVKEILAYSARLNDFEDPSWQVNGARNHNGGGLFTNDNYGFGMLDATAAVRLAETWHKQSVYANEAHVGFGREVALAIPDGGLLEYTFDIEAGVSVETIELDFWITHAEFGDLVMELVSPDGTTSTLLYRTGDGRTTELTTAVLDVLGSPADMTNIIHTLTSNDFMGETSGGTWTLRIADQKLGDVGDVHGLALRAYGAAATSDQTYIYTNDFATSAAADFSRTTLNNSVGTHSLNLAAVTGAVTVDLAAGRANIVGTDLTISAGTKIGTVFTGDGADVVTLASRGGKALLGRGDDTASAVKGELDGGRGFDRLQLSDALDHYRIFSNNSVITLTHKDSSDLVLTENIEYFAFGADAADILVLTTNAVQAQVARFYDLVLNGTADFEGLAYWSGRAADGAGLGAIASSFSASSEFAAASQHLADDVFIDQLYTRMLNRAADESGATYWTNQIASGVDRNEVAASFALSAEAASIEIGHVHLIGAGSETLIA